MPGFDSMGVAPCLRPQGQEDLKTLLAQLDRRTLFAMGLALDREPTLARQELSPARGGSAERFQR